MIRRTQLMKTMASSLFISVYLLAALAITSHSAFAQDSKPVVTPEALLNYPIASNSKTGDLTCWIPGTNSVIWTISEPGDDPSKGNISCIERIDMGTGERTRIAVGSKPTVSPDGKRIAYMSDETGNSQIWIANTDGTEAKQVSHAEGGLNDPNFCWSPDGTQLAYAVASDPPAPDPQKTAEPKVKSSVAVYNHPSVIGQYEGDADLWILNITDGSARKLTSLRGKMVGYQGGMAWLSDDYLSIFRDLEWNEPEFSYTQVFQQVEVSLKSGALVPYVDPKSAITFLSVPSPDGKTIAMVCSQNHGGLWNYSQVAIAPASGGSLRVVHTPFKAIPYGWSADGTSIFVRKRDGALYQILLMGLDGKIKGLAAQGFFDRLHTNAIVSKDGQVAWIDSDPKGRVRLMVSSLQNPQGRAVIDFSDPSDRFAMGDYENIHWKNKAGIECAGLLIKPVGYEKGSKYPLLVSLHGGPAGGIGIGDIGALSRTEDALEAQMWAGKGYVVFYPEYQSSGETGIDYFMQMHRNHDMFSGDLDDITSGVQHLVDVGLADPQKLAVVGHSAGAIETDWIITHSHLFKAAVSYEGDADWYVDGWNVNGDMTQGFDFWMLGGSPVTAPQNYIKNSAIYFVKGVTTPTLFINCDGGIDSQSTPRMYIALKEQGIDTQYLLYKGEGHVATKPENVRNILYWYLNWVDTHLGFPPTPDPTGDFNVADLKATVAESKDAESTSSSSEVATAP